MQLSGIDIIFKGVNIERLIGGGFLKGQIYIVWINSRNSYDFKK